MVSLNILKQFDLFKRPVKIYFTKTLNEKGKKQYEVEMGSYLGTFLSAFVATSVLAFMFFTVQSVLDGEHDQYEWDLINHGEGTNLEKNFTNNLENFKNNTGRYDLFLPMLSFKLYDSFDNESELENDPQFEDVFNVFSFSKEK